jgi:hypothetical protein
MTTEIKTDSYIRILKHPDSGLLADCHLPLYSGQLYGRGYRGLMRNLKSALRTYLKENKENPSSPKEIGIKSEPTRVEEVFDRYSSLSEKELARIRKVLAKRIPGVTFC